MQLAYTLHNVVHKGANHDPGKVIELDSASYAELERLGAVREPNDREKALHGMTVTRKPAVQQTTFPEKVDADRADLEDRARAAGVKFNKNLSTEKLRERVDEAETAAPTTSDDDDDAPADNDPDVIG